MHGPSTVHCFQNIWFNKRTHLNEHRNAYCLSTKCVLASDQSSVSSRLVQAQGVVVCGRAVCRKRLCIVRQLRGKVKVRPKTMSNSEVCAFLRVLFFSQNNLAVNPASAR